MNACLLPYRPNPLCELTLFAMWSLPSVMTRNNVLPRRNDETSEKFWAFLNYHPRPATPSIKLPLALPSRLTLFANQSNNILPSYSEQLICYASRARLRNLSIIAVFAQSIGGKYVARDGPHQRSLPVGSAQRFWRSLCYGGKGSLLRLRPSLSQHVLGVFGDHGYRIDYAVTTISFKLANAFLQ